MHDSTKTFPDPKLISIVPLVLDRPKATITEWSSTILSGGFSGAQITRFAGVASESGERLPWSVIRKVVNAPTVWRFLHNDDPAHQGYWKRELLAESSSVLESKGNELVAPRCYGVDSSPTAYTLWFEDIGSGINEAWSAERFGLAARHLGQFNGRRMLDADFLIPNWYCRNIHQQRAPLNKARWAALESVREHALVRRGLPDTVLPTMQHIWDEKESLIALLETLPKTIIHGDASRKNLIDRTRGGEHETVGIDWASLGVGAIGEELAPLVVGTSLFPRGDQDESLSSRADRSLVEYVQGLREGGWTGSDADCRLGFLVASFLRYGTIIVEVGIAAGLVTEQFCESTLGCSSEAAADRLRPIREYFVENMEEVQAALQR